MRPAAVDVVDETPRSPAAGRPQISNYLVFTESRLDFCSELFRRGFLPKRCFAARDFRPYRNNDNFLFLPSIVARLLLLGNLHFLLMFARYIQISTQLIYIVGLYESERWKLNPIFISIFLGTTRSYPRLILPGTSTLTWKSSGVRIP